MSILVYGDITNLAGCLAAGRVLTLRHAGVDIAWRAVEADPSRPAGGIVRTPAQQAKLTRERAHLAELLLPGEKLPEPPRGPLPNAQAAVSAYAEAYGIDMADDVLRVLSDAYWRDGLNIGSPELLRTRLAGPILRGRSASLPLGEFGWAVSMSGGPVTTEAWHRVRQWRADWVALGRPSLPTLVVAEEEPVSGEDALRRLEKEILLADAPIEVSWPDPTRYPPSVWAQKGWMTDSGGPWRDAWKNVA